MPKILRNPAVIASVVAIILIMAGLMFPNRTNATHQFGYTHTPTPVTPAPASQQQPPAPQSEEEKAEQAQGIYRNYYGTATVFLHTLGANAGSVEIHYAGAGQVAFFGPDLVKNLPQSITKVIGADTWVTTLTPSPLGNNYIHVTITKNGVKVGEFDAKVRS